MALRVLLDTNRLTDVFRGDPELLQRMELAEELWVPFVAVAEMRAGFLGGSRPESNEFLLDRFLAKPGVEVLYPDRETLGIYARLFQQLRRGGTPIPTNDLWIAALALQHNLTLFTRDAHFDRLPQIDCR